MKLVATVCAATCLLAAGAQAKSNAVLGFDWQHRMLAWFDPATLKPLPGRKAPIPTRGACSWSFSPDRARLAFSDCNGTLRVIDARTMRVAGDVATGGWLGSVDQLAWLRPDRLLATRHGDEATTLIVIDPLKRKVVRRVEVTGLVSGRTVVGDQAVYLRRAIGRFEPAEVATVDADGNIRRVTVERVSAGAIYDETDGDYLATVRAPGFAVDPVGRRAFVVAPELVVGEVDLSTLEVTYHGPTRTLAKAVDGPERTAAWLGDGLLAVAGADYATTGTGTARKTTAQPYGLRIVDTRTWTWRTIDPQAMWFQRAPAALVVNHGDGAKRHEAVAWGYDGSLRYRVALPAQSWLEFAGELGYVCKGDAATAVVDAATGRQVAALKGRDCVRLLGDATSPY